MQLAPAFQAVPAAISSHNRPPPPPVLSALHFTCCVIPGKLPYLSELVSVCTSQAVARCEGVFAPGLHGSWHREGLHKRVFTERVKE